MIFGRNPAVRMALTARSTAPHTALSVPDCTASLVLASGITVGALVDRLKREPADEVIVATNPTADGEATALYLAQILKPLGTRVTRIAHGLPVGADIEYADSLTVGRAIDGRREM